MEITKENFETHLSVIDQRRNRLWVKVFIECTKELEERDSETLANLAIELREADGQKSILNSLYLEYNR